MAQARQAAKLKTFLERETMNILQKINELKNKARTKINQNQDQSRKARLLKSIEARRNAETERSIRENKKAASDIRLAPLKQFGKGVKERLATRSKAQNTQANSVFNSSNNTYNPIYHGNAGKGSKGSNIFTQTTGTNPFNFTSNNTKEKLKPKTIIIKKY